MVLTLAYCRISRILIYFKYLVILNKAICFKGGIIAMDLKKVKWLPKKIHTPRSAKCQVCKRILYFQNGRFGHATLDMVTVSHEPIPEEK